MDWMRKALGYKFEAAISMTSLLTSVLGSVASAVVGNLFSSGDDDDDEVPPPVAAAEKEELVMPEADDESARKARRQAIYQRLAKSQGRASTVLTDSGDNGDTLG